MILQGLSSLLPEFLADLLIASAFFTCVAVFVALRWMKQRGTKLAIERARMQRDRGLENMGKAVQQHWKEVGSAHTCARGALSGVDKSDNFPNFVRFGR
ncbi:hypothetical protein NDU88_001730 [Pleurodeles waltl]|uniref:Uncharacterized protein n=1 Tax=Pleurodeles waltl TaxID=8319 RepID=A0AAV7T0B7_PLEWA|nr:hypothetical protein NDU88_001730 [Pleurodeles waltl]